MDRNLLFLSVLLACLFGLSQQTDKDTFSGSGGGGGGGVTFEDDEDLADVGSGSGSGSGEGSGKEEIENMASTYVATINISSQAFTPELANPESQLYLFTAKRIRQDLEDLFAYLPGEQTVVILSFSKGSLMTTFELRDSGNSNPDVTRKVLEDTLKKGRLGENRVSTVGFNFKAVNTPVSTTRMTPTSTTTTAPRALTECEIMRDTRKRLAGSKYLPRCGPKGEFEALQCSKHVGTDDCWCVDLDGSEIPGTRMESPNFPDCDGGYNMAHCVYTLVKNRRKGLFGSFRPKCTLDGNYDRVQCTGSLCYCVDEEKGTTVDGTEVHIPATPNCDDESTEETETVPPAVNKWEPEEVKTTAAPKEPEITFPKETVLPPVKEEKTTVKKTTPKPTTEPTESGIIFPGEGKETINLEEGGDSTEDGDTINIHIHLGGKNEEDKDDSKDGDGSEEGNDTGNGEDEVLLSERTETKSRVKENQILTQPGLLGGIIGGAVVLLLGLVLLIMFIVYRMRKKDEGSYPLDEPRKAPNYSYVRAPEKEYYA